MSKENPFKKAGGGNKPLIARSKDSKKSVNVGITGQTPKKFIPYEENIKSQNFFDQEISDLPNDVSQIETVPLYEEIQSLNKERPKTSRGKSRPSPDEFYNYVVPSPDHNKGSRYNRMIFDRTNGKGAVLVSDDLKLKGFDGENSKQPEISDSVLFGLNLNGIEREKQVTLLACWLFGSSMRV